jgi:hypothetical protein
MAIDQTDVRNMHISDIIPEYVECPKCGESKYFVSQRSTGTTLVKFPVCETCDEILRLSKIGMKKVADWRAEKARKAAEAERRRRIQAAIAWTVAFVVIIGFFVYLFASTF